MNFNFVFYYLFISYCFNSQTLNFTTITKYRHLTVKSEKKFVD